MSQYGNYKITGWERKSCPERTKSASFWIFGAAAIIILGIIIGISGCKTHQTVIKEEIVTRYVDSVVWHTDTTYFEIPKEVYADYTSLLDTLYMETSYAMSWSAVDTNNMLLVGELRNKEIKVPIKYLWKDRVVMNDTTIFKDKIEYVPYEVEVVKTKIPTWAWWCLFISIGLLCYVIWKIYKRFFL